MLGKIMGFFIRILVFIAGASLSAMMLLTTFDVIGRYFFNSPLLGTYELTELLVGFFSPIAIVCCAWNKGHISVDIVFNHLPKSVRYFSIFLTVVVQLGLSIALAYQSFFLISELMGARIKTPVLGLPYWPTGIAITCAFVFLVLIYVMELLNSLYGNKEVTE